MKILLVDDHAILRAGLRRILMEDLGAEVGEAADGDEAMLELRRTAWDVVLLDISLPGRSGLDLLPDIRCAYPTVRVIVLSSFGDHQFAVRALRDGAVAFLTKERAARELLDAIRTVMGGRRFITGDLADRLASLIACDGPKAPHETLSSREFEVFRLIATAKSPTEISVLLHISTKTVGTYRARILEKMGMDSNAELMQYAIRHALVN
ncbi:MAG: DNA-binding response regulator [Burkholderiales bacterium RIFCSPLOWO2_12_FULL_61_40]|nr:MAG: DNA-binding response regulator [Burkholderiales bacterium RIFCSPLOWO2_12_FULL_61_40]